MNIKGQYSAILLCCGMLLFTSACGKSDSPAASSTTTTISGSVFAAPVTGSSVVVKDRNGATIAGPVITTAEGTYAIVVPNSALTNSLSFEATGGAFVDEATGTTTTAGKLAAYIDGGTLAAGSSVHLDPSATIIHNLMTSGSATSIAGAKAAFNAIFGYTPDSSVQPMNTAATGTTNLPNRLAAVRAAVFSQLAKDLGITPDKQFDLITAISDDLADNGKLDGSAAAVNGVTIPEDIQNNIEASLITYMSNTTANLTGCTSGDMGDLLFGKVALTPTYRVEYVPGMMPAAPGKTQFKVKITNRTGGAAAAGLTLSLMPKMHMPMMTHTTPVDVVTEDPVHPGTYDCTVYYVMASGPGMGFWDLKVMIGGMMGESATFHPAVGMAMGANTVRVTLNGTMDMATSMTNTMGSKRSYYLFNDGLISGMTSTFNVFIAAMESMMNMPAVSGGTILTSPTGTWTVDPGTSSLKASADNMFPAESTVTAVDNGNGHWSLPGLDLSSSMTSTVYVKFTVNDEVKTAGTSSTSLAYGTFVIAPAGGM